MKRNTRIEQPRWANPMDAMVPARADHLNRRFCPAKIPSINRSAGVALVIVLGMLVLVTTLVVAFLTSVSTELKSAKSYASQSDSRTLADSAVNIVISQIQDATTTPSLAWASQPGMIRTYDDRGEPVEAFKLYSSGQLRIPGAFDPVSSLSTEVPGNWSGSPAIYTDLNAPVAVAGEQYYPILNPAAVAADASGEVALDGSSTPIEGCFLDTSNAATLVTATQTNPVPFPVQWLYVLEDGQLSAIDPTSKKVTGATSDNPVVGRVAFWTDDETSKVNINTASEGTFWDRPWTHGDDITGSFPQATSPSYERRLGINMPAQNEFQRYPGHPAMTSLSAVFPRLDGEEVVDYNARIFGIIPRIADGGSISGTINVNQTTQPIAPDTDRLFASVDEFLFGVSGSPRNENEKKEGEAFTHEDIEKVGFFLTANSRAPEVNLFNKPRVTLWPLQIDPDPVSNMPTRNAKDRLIAFASTVGDKPYYFQRYSTYLAHTAASPNPQPSSQSPRMDWDLISRNQELYTYLQSVTSRPIPGLGGSLKAKYPETRDQLLTQMLDYVRSGVNTFNTGETPNTTTGSPHYYYTPFSPTGFVTAQSQVVPLVVPQDSGRPEETKGFGRFNTITEAALIFYTKTPLRITGNVPPGGVIKWGSGDSHKMRWGKEQAVWDKNSPPTPEQQSQPPYSYPAGLALENFEIENIEGEGNAYIRLTGTDYVLSSETDSTFEVGAVLILEPFNPSPGPPPWTGSYKFVVKGLGNFKADGSSMGFPDDSSDPPMNYVASIDTQSNATAMTGLETFLQHPPRKAKKLGVSTLQNPEVANYPFFGSFTVDGPIPGAPPTTAPTFNFSGGKIQIEIYAGAADPEDPDELVQTIHMDFPSASFPIPQLGQRQIIGDETRITLPHKSAPSFTDYDNRMSYIHVEDNKKYERYGIAEYGRHAPLPLIVGSAGSPYLGDTVRSVEARAGGPTRGDYRLMAAMKTVPASFYEAHGMNPSTDPSLSGRTYADTATSSRLVHSLSVHGIVGNSDTSASNGYYAGAGRSNDPRGKLVADVDYRDPNRSGSTRDRKVPIVPRGLTSAKMLNGAPGDWDTGIGAQPDGPYINPADQATSQRGSSNNALYYSDGQQLTGKNFIELGGASFSPNRQISSAVAFGSLPVGADPHHPNPADANAAATSGTEPWRTLLFSKNPLAGTAHPGFGIPADGPPYTTAPDHAVLDLFHMPIVEPYAVSEAFSTAGKVNMNYQIVPFTYLTRSTAVRAVLKSTNIMAIPTTDGQTYKLSNTNPDYRFTINPDEQTGTLAGFEERFQSGDIFRSASEITNIFLVPQDRVNGDPVPGNPTYTSMADWWSNYRLTGDNVREQPYGHIYPRITTKSNTFKVHVKSQSLQKVPGTPPDEFIDGRDQVTGEFRGSFIIERYLDPNSDSLVKADGKTPANETDVDAMVGPYKFRIVSSKRFAP